jgi:hypothetical protein
MRKETAIILIAAVLLLGSALRAAEGGNLKIELATATKVSAAVAIAAGLKVESPGKIDGTTITFERLLPDTAYDVRLTLADGTTLQGVDLNWYTEEETKPDAGPLRDEDRKEMLGILSIPDFYNKKDILIYQGDHSRAATLVQLVRDKDFYAGGGQVIWRIEIYYFKNQHGGWEKLAQVNKILRRERFKTHDLFKMTTNKIKYLAALGGLKLDKNQTERTVKIETLAAAP